MEDEDNAVRPKSEAVLDVSDILNLHPGNFADAARLYFTGTDYTINLIPHAVVILLTLAALGYFLFRLNLLDGLLGGIGGDMLGLGGSGFTSAGYGAPPSSSYGAPSPSYGAPSPSYGAPSPSFNSPSPSPSYNSPSPSYDSPSPSYTPTRSFEVSLGSKYDNVLENVELTPEQKALYPQLLQLQRQLQLLQMRKYIAANGESARYFPQEASILSSSTNSPLQLQYSY